MCADVSPSPYLGKRAGPRQASAPFLGKLHPVTRVHTHISYILEHILEVCNVQRKSAMQDAGKTNKAHINIPIQCLGLHATHTSLKIQMPLLHNAMNVAGTQVFGQTMIHPITVHHVGIAQNP